MFETLYSISFGQVKILPQPIINTHFHLSRTCFNTELLYLSFYVYLFVCGEPGQLYLKGAEGLTDERKDGWLEGRKAEYNAPSFFFEKGGTQ